MTSRINDTDFVAETKRKLKAAYAADIHAQTKGQLKSTKRHGQTKNRYLVPLLKKLHRHQLTMAHLLA